MSILIVTKNGFATSSKDEEFTAKARGGLGVNGVLIDEKTGPAVAIENPIPGTNVIVLTAKGKTAKFAVEEVRETYRGSGCIKVISLVDGDEVVAVTITP